MNAKFNPVIKLVDVQKGEPTTTTLQIAVGLELVHKTVIQLVRTYLPDIQEFGRVKFESLNSAFEMANSERESTRGRHTRYAVLNEQQSYFLMTLMRNSPKDLETIYQASTGLVGDVANGALWLVALGDAPASNQMFCSFTFKSRLRFLG